MTAGTAEFCKDKNICTILEVKAESCWNSSYKTKQSNLDISLNVAYKNGNHGRIQCHY